MNRRALLAAALASPAMVGATKAAEPPRDLAQFDVLRALCPPTFEAIKTLTELRQPIIEIGPGNGYWVRPMLAAGIDAKGFDIRPSGPDVILGDHRDAARASAADAAMLAVWPPDGAEVRRWITARSWPVVVLVGSAGRFDVGDTLRAYTLRETITLPAGRKGANWMSIYDRA